MAWYCCDFTYALKVLEHLPLDRGWPQYISINRIKPGSTLNPDVEKRAPLGVTPPTNNVVSLSGCRSNQSPKQRSSVPDILFVMFSTVFFTSFLQPSFLQGGSSISEQTSLMGTDPAVSTF